jgi:NCS1 family nucleobase:cation symporter-1
MTTPASPSEPQTLPAAQFLDQLYEFDREPVSPDRQLGPGYFIGSFSGEHVAATEFVIGVLFVNWGASLRDIFLGLAIGNLLAVLTWTFVCAPIAVETRLTFYWYLRRIGGPALTVIYNVLNALLFCILAGCMITVSASAVRIPFHIPAQVHWYPDDWRFVLVVLVIGAVVVTLAILGFKKLASFATVLSPWMFLMFLAGAVVVLPRLAQEAGAATWTSFDALRDIGGRIVWTGRTPDGSPPLGFWKVAAFAWICNLAMHAGLADMALFRFARKSSYGLCSAFGMFLGHYLAWICAGMMGVGAALLLQTPLAKLDSGDIAFQTLGWAGALAVLAAGWTTSNPTLYRAGLALQAVTPNWSRARITLVAGVLTTIVACFPFVFTRLLDFVGLYGLLLAPVGAVVITEHWLFPRLGLNRYWAAQRTVNWPALLSWMMAVAFALALERTGTLHLFFLAVPVYVLTAMLYIGLAAIGGAKEAAPETVPQTASPHHAPASAAPNARPAGSRRTARWASGVVALAALAACLALPFQVALGGTGDFPARLDSMKSGLLLSTLLYLVAGAVFYHLWQKEHDASHV